LDLLMRDFKRESLTPPQYVPESIFHEIESLVSMIASVTGHSLLETARSLRDENRQLGSTVWKELKRQNIQPYRWTDELIEFYESTNAFLYESLVWNRSMLKHQIQKRILRYLAEHFGGKCRVLVYGDGLGFDSSALAMAGHQVSYFEVSRKAIGFARHLFDWLECDVEILTDEKAIAPGTFDAVVCLDVLEHVPKPVEMVQSLSRAISDKGRLMIHAPFWYVAPSVGTHLISNRRYSGAIQSIYHRNGLRAVDGTWFWDPIVLARKTASVRPTMAIAAKLSIGGSLLSTARLWSAPHGLISQKLLKRSLGVWPALERYLAKLESSNSSVATTSNE
jgi:SAM-dependent methyltransferase